MQDYDMYPPYVSVAERRAKAEQKIRQLRKKNPKIKPVIIEGRALATTWWGKSWNQNLERYADYNYRLERGRSYVRHRSVVDLQIKAGHITALVQGSSAQPYKIAIKVDKLSDRNWTAIRQACAGGLDSLRALLGGQFPPSLKEVFFQEGKGLFPTPREIHFQCNCPDGAAMCKHIAAALYGVGARLDEDPSLFFKLRQIDVDDLITKTVADTAQALLDKAGQQSSNILEGVDLGDVFGIELDDIDMPLPDLPAVAPKPAAAKKKIAKADAKTKVSAGPSPATGTMLDALVKTVGRARKGKSVEQLQDKLGWTRTQVRNTITRASAKGFIETVKPGWYRRVL